jgi:hypothetical protein
LLAQVTNALSLQGEYVMIDGACAAIKMFLVSESRPLIVATFFDTISQPYGYIHCKTGNDAPRAVEWTAELKVEHCTIVEREDGIVDFVPVDRITPALIPAGFIAEVLLNHRNGTYPAGPNKRKKAAPKKSAATKAKKKKPPKRRSSAPAGTSD